MIRKIPNGHTCGSIYSAGQRQYNAHWAKTDKKKTMTTLFWKRHAEERVKWAASMRISYSSTLTLDQSDKYIAATSQRNASSLLCPASPPHSLPNYENVRIINNPYRSNHEHGGGNKVTRRSENVVNASDHFTILVICLVFRKGEEEGW